MRPAIGTEHVLYAYVLHKTICACYCPQHALYAMNTLLLKLADLLCCDHPCLDAVSHALQERTALADTPGSVFTRKCEALLVEGSFGEVLNEFAEQVDVLFKKVTDKGEGWWSLLRLLAIVSPVHSLTVIQPHAFCASQQAWIAAWTCSCTSHRGCRKMSGQRQQPRSLQQSQQRCAAERAHALRLSFVLAQGLPFACTHQQPSAAWKGTRMKRSMQ